MVPHVSCSLHSDIRQDEGSCQPTLIQSRLRRERTVAKSRAVQEAEMLLALGYGHHFIFPATLHTSSETHFFAIYVRHPPPQSITDAGTHALALVFYSGSLTTSSLVDLSDSNAMWSHRLSVIIPAAIPLSSLSIIVLFPRNFGFSLHALFDGDRTAGLE